MTNQQEKELVDAIKQIAQQTFNMQNTLEAIKHLLEAQQAQQTTPKL